jgi:hypothetical protein
LVSSFDVRSFIVKLSLDFDESMLLSFLLVEKPPVVQLFKNFPVFYGIVGCKRSINNNGTVPCVYMLLESCQK